jgi:hypothetical protein
MQYLLFVWALCVVGVGALDLDLPVQHLQQLTRSTRRAKSSCDITSRVLDAAARSLDREFGFYVTRDCQSFTCTANLQNFPSYKSYKSACAAAKGSFHLFSIDVSCSFTHLDFSNYPICLVSQRADPSCDPSLGEDKLGKDWDIDECTSTISHTGTTDYYVAPRPVMRPVKRPVMRPVMRPMHRRSLTME